MSKKSKAAAKARRKSGKANVKAQRKALYAGFAKEGKSKRREVKASKVATFKPGLHKVRCGNVGCTRCGSGETRRERLVTAIALAMRKPRNQVVLKSDPRPGRKPPEVTRAAA